MADIFLSYASVDLERIRPLVKILEEQGWSVWWDRRIPPGKTWHQVIQQALDESKCVVVIWSQQSIQSDWVITEAEEGKDRQALIPVLIDNVKAPLAFRRIQAARLINWHGESSHLELGMLFEAIETIVGKPEKTQEAVRVEQRPEKPLPSSSQALETHLNPPLIAGADQEHSPPPTQRPDDTVRYDAQIRTKDGFDGDDFDDVLDIPRPRRVTRDSPDSFAPFDTPKEASEPEFKGGPTLPEKEVSEPEFMGWPVLPEKEVSEPEFMGWPTLPEGADEEEEEDISSPLRFRLIIGGVSVIIMLAILVFSYFYTREQSQRREANEQAQTQPQVENQNQKDERIERLRDRIARISKQIQMMNKPALKVKRDIWTENLNKFSQQLDGISKMSSEQLPKIAQACDEIGRELDKIEEEIRSLQG